MPPFIAFVLRRIAFLGAAILLMAFVPAGAQVPPGLLPQHPAQMPRDTADSDIFGARARDYQLRVKAKCPACKPEEDAVDAATARYKRAFDEFVARISEAGKLREELASLEYRHEHASSQLAHHLTMLSIWETSDSLEGREKSALAKAMISWYQKELVGLPEKILELRRRVPEAEKQADEAKQRMDRASDALNDAQVYLYACNKEKCKAELEAELEERVARLIGSAANEAGASTSSVELSGTVGVLGNNPFFPPNPIGTPRGNPPPVTGSGPGTLQFNSASYGGAEGGAVLITVVRSGGSAGIVSVQYETLRGTASEDDFKRANGTLSWNDRDATPKSFSIALSSDTVVEDVESFSVILSNPGGGAPLGSPSTATVSISDTGAPQPPQPAGTLQFAQSAYSVGEAAGSITITVTRTGGSAGTVSVQYFTGAGSALAGSDYQQANGVLTWGPGDTGARTFAVPIINDATPEGDEGFFVTLNGPTGGATLGAPSTANVTIVDDDAASAPCGSTGNAWTPNTGTYMCSGNCEPSSPQALSVNADIVSITQFHQGGTATFQGCGPVLTSTRNDLRYFQQSNHTATISRSGNTALSASVRSATGSCGFTCTKTSQ